MTPGATSDWRKKILETCPPIKYFLDILSNKLERFLASRHYNSSLIIGNTVGADPIGAYLVLCSNSRLQALSTNIRLLWKCLIFTNTLAYNKTHCHVNEYQNLTDTKENIFLYKYLFQQTH